MNESMDDPEDGGAAARAAAGVGAEWGMVVSFERNGTEYLVDVLAMVADQPVDMKNNNPTRGKRFQIKPIVPISGDDSSSSSSSLNNGEPRVVQVPLSQVESSTLTFFSLFFLFFPLDS